MTLLRTPARLRYLMQSRHIIRRAMNAARERKVTMQAPRILFAGGGSGGHLTPSVAVWRAIQTISPDAVAHFICSEREDDAAFLRKEDVPFDQLPLIRRSVSAPFRLWQGYRQSRAILQRFRPAVVFSKGGSVSAAVALAAHHLRIPIVLHESDAVSGKANRWASRWAKVICLGFPTNDKRSATGSQSSSVEHRRIFTGNPVRPEVLQGSRERGLRLCGFSGTRPIVLVMGGSQGAQALNDIVRARLDDLLGLCDVIHLTGRGKENKEERPGYFIRAFAHADLAHMYAIADACISRAGASSIAELSVLRIPTLLVPLRGVAQDHQLANATVASTMGGFRMIEQDILPREIVSTVRELLFDERSRASMQEAMQHFAVPDAAEHIAKILLDCIGS